MKKDIEKINAIRNSEKERNQFLKEKKEQFEDFFISYGFLSNIDQLKDSILMNALQSYQETTPILFPFYLKGYLQKEFSKIAQDYLKENHCSIDLKIIRYCQLFSSKKDDRFFTLPQIYTTLSISSSEYVTFQQLLKNCSIQEIEKIIPTYTKQKQARDKENKKTVKSFKKNIKKRKLNQMETIYLALYLGGINDICQDVEEIAKRFKKQELEVTKILKNALIKISEDQEIEENFFREYPDCKKIYPIRKKGLLPKRKYQKNEETIQSKSELFFEKYEILKRLLQQDQHGFFPSQKKTAEEMDLKYSTFQRNFKKLKTLLEQKEIFEEACNQIENFEVLYAAYCEEEQKDDFSKIDLQILKNQFEQTEDGTIQKRTYREIASLISTDVLKFDEVFVERKLNTLKIYFKNHPESKEKFLEEHPLYKEYRKLGKNERRSKTKENLTQEQIYILENLLKQDQHGFFPSQNEIAKKMDLKYSSISNNWNKIKKLLQQKEIFEDACKNFETFEILYATYCDELKRGSLSKIDLQILENQLEKADDGTIQKRTYKKIASLISTDILKFDEVFVEKKLNLLTIFFKNHPEIKEEFLENHLLYKEYRKLGKRKREPKTKENLSQEQILILENLLKQDQHGFFPIKKEIAKKMDYQYSSFINIYRKTKTLLQQKEIFEDTCKKLENFEVLYAAYCDEEQKDDLSKIDLQILKNQFGKAEDGTIQKRTYQEIASLISTDVLKFDEVFVERKLNTLKIYFKNHPEIKEKFLEEHPLYKEYKKIGKNKSKTKEKKIEKLSQEQIYILENLLKQDQHGFFLSQNKIAKKIDCKYSSISNNWKKIKKLLQQKEIFEDACNQIENFEILYATYCDELKKGSLSKIDLQILENQLEKEDDGTIQKRTYKKIASLISTDILKFDEVFVEKKLNLLTIFFKNHPEIKEEFLENHLLYKEYRKLGKRKREPKTKENLSQEQILILENLLKQDQHGFFPIKKEIAKKMDYQYSSFINMWKKIKTLLQQKEIFEEACNQIENFEVLYAAYCEEEQKGKFSTIQLQILENRFKNLEDGTIKKRTYKEIASLISTDVLKFDETFVSKKLNSIYHFFEKHPKIREQYSFPIPKDKKQREESRLKASFEKCQLMIKNLEKAYFNFSSLWKKHLRSEENETQISLTENELETIREIAHKNEENEKNPPSLSQERESLLNQQVEDELLLYQNYETSKIYKNQNDEKPIVNLESSIFKDFISICTEKQKLILALRLGYYHQRIYSTEEVSQLCNVPKEIVTTLTHNCLLFGKEILEQSKQKQFQKRKE